MPRAIGGLLSAASVLGSWLSTGRQEEACRCGENGPFCTWAFSCGGQFLHWSISYGEACHVLLPCKGSHRPKSKLRIDNPPRTFSCHAALHLIFRGRVLSTARLLRFAAAALLFLSLASPAQAQTYWMLPPGQLGDWSNPSNWDSGVPTSSKRIHCQWRNGHHQPTGRSLWESLSRRSWGWKLGNDSDDRRLHVGLSCTRCGSARAKSSVAAPACRLPQVTS